MALLSHGSTADQNYAAPHPYSKSTTFNQSESKTQTLTSPNYQTSNQYHQKHKYKPRIINQPLYDVKCKFFHSKYGNYCRYGEECAFKHIFYPQQQQTTFYHQPTPHIFPTEYQNDTKREHKHAPYPKATQLNLSTNPTIISLLQEQSKINKILRKIATSIGINNDLTPSTQNPPHILLTTQFAPKQQQSPPNTRSQSNPAPKPNKNKNKNKHKNKNKNNKHQNKHKQQPPPSPHQKKEPKTSKKQTPKKNTNTKSTQNPTKSTSTKSKTRPAIKCNICNKTEHLSRCSRCQEIWYCSHDHLKEDWPNHKKYCTPKLKQQPTKHHPKKIKSQSINSNTTNTTKQNMNSATPNATALNPTANIWAPPTSREHVLELTRELDAATNKVDIDNILSILKKLMTTDIHIELLKESNLGGKVNEIRKSKKFKANNNINEAANKLIAKWKKFITAEKRALHKETPHEIEAEEKCNNTHKLNTIKYTTGSPFKGTPLELYQQQHPQQNVNETLIKTSGRYDFIIWALQQILPQHFNINNEDQLLQIVDQIYIGTAHIDNYYYLIELLYNHCESNLSLPANRFIFIPTGYE